MAGSFLRKEWTSGVETSIGGIAAILGFGAVVKPHRPTNQYRLGVGLNMNPLLLAVVVDLYCLCHHAGGSSFRTAHHVARTMAPTFLASGANL